MWLGCVVLWCFGCQTSRRIVEAQTPGVASGAGATFTGPANSGQQSTQTAARTISFAPPSVRVPQPTIPVINISEPNPSATFAPLPPPSPAWIQERVETTIGAHQDAAGLVKAAAAMSGWGVVRWCGLIGCIVGLGGLLHSAGNHESGYPMVWVLTAATGGVLLITGNGWLFALACAPFGLWAAQKFGLLKLPL
jgi:hypothetical protein